MRTIKEEDDESEIASALKKAASALSDETSNQTGTPFKLHEMQSLDSR